MTGRMQGDAPPVYDEEFPVMNGAPPHANPFGCGIEMAIPRYRRPREPG